MKRIILGLGIFSWFLPQREEDLSGRRRVSDGMSVAADLGICLFLFLV